MSDLAVLSRARGPQAQALVALVEEATKKISARKFETGMRALRSKMEKTYTARMEVLLRDLGKHLVKVTEEQGGLVIVQPTPQEAATTGPITLKEAARINAILKAAKLPQWAKDKVLPYLDSLYAGAFAGAYGLSQLHLEATARDKAAQAVMKEGGRRLGLIDFDVQTKDAMFRVLEFAKNWESGVPDARTVAGWIRSEVPAGRFVNAGSKYRALMIARTETLHATRKASIETYRQSPVIDRLLAIDGDGDEECTARNGQEYSFDDAEYEMDSDVTHPNCVLMFAPAYTK